MTFSHHGDVGDLIACLPAIRHMGGGDLVLYPRPGQCREPFTPAKVAALQPLLECQPYISSVRFAEQPEGIVLDEWRKGYKPGLNLTEMCLRWFKLPPVTEPWLGVEPLHVAPVVFARSPRYHQSDDLWRQLVAKYPDAVFVGHPSEVDALENVISPFHKCDPPIRYYPTQDFLTLARVIAGASLFCGNQSAPLWLQLAMFGPTIVEENQHCPNCHWDRDNAFYFKGVPAELPDL